MLDRMVECAIGDSEGDVALDLYAGVGLFAAGLKGRFKEVIAVESARSALFAVFYWGRFGTFERSRQLVSTRWVRFVGSGARGKDFTLFWVA